jgi:hypothetical protein
MSTRSTWLDHSLVVKRALLQQWVAIERPRRDTFGRTLRAVTLASGRWPSGQEAARMPPRCSTPT